MTFQKESREIDRARELIELSWAYRSARVVQVVSEAGLFEDIGKAGTVSADRIAGSRKLNANLAEKLLITCAAMGYVERDSEGWRLSEKGKALLLPDALLYQGHTLAHSADVWTFWNDLDHKLRGEEGGSLFSPDGPDRPRSHTDFILSTHDMTVAGRAAELADRVDLSGKRRLIDIGGGPGTYTIALCERYPDLRGTVFDLSETIEITREVILRFGMTDRIDTVTGSWDEDEFGEGFDALLMSNVLHGPTSGAEMKLEKARRSLVPGGTLIVQDFLMNSEKTGPLKPALFNLMVGAFSLDELMAQIEGAGFSDLNVSSMPEDLGTSLIVASR